MNYWTLWFLLASSRNPMNGEFAFYVGAACLILGAIALYNAAKEDEENYYVTRATPLPISLLQEGDDVWVEGKVETNRPLTAPYFQYSCLYFHYKVEEKRGKNWEVVEEDEDKTIFWLYEGDHKVYVDGRSAEFKFCTTETRKEGLLKPRRITLTYFPYPLPQVAAAGYVTKKKDGNLWLVPYQNIPLVVSPLSRNEYYEKVEAEEAWKRKWGHLGIGFGTFCLAQAFQVVKQYGFVETNSFINAAGLVTSFMPTSAFVALAVLLPIWFVFTYNRISALKMRVENAWRNIDVDLKMRYDLIPNLVSTVKGYLKYEQDVLTTLAKLRSQALQGSRSEQISLDGETSQAVKKLFALYEKYPDLKSQPVVENLMNKLRFVEEKIAHGRKVYNEVVTEYNTYISTFPPAIVAALRGMQREPLFSQREAMSSGKKYYRVYKD